MSLPTSTALRALAEGDLVVAGRVTDASNVVLWCELRVPWALPRGAESVHVMYKPVSGERPLADFPTGTLANCEEAAWHVSEATGWSIVPPTMVRDGPAGAGMVQLWIDTDDDADVLRMILTRDDRLRRMAVFDALVNNADRKGGHLLVTGSTVHGCDHGICFSPEPKLRTVLWGWRGEPLLDAEREMLRRVHDELQDRWRRSWHRCWTERKTEVPGGAPDDCCGTVGCRCRTRTDTSSRGRPSGLYRGRRTEVPQARPRMGRYGASSVPALGGIACAPCSTASSVRLPPRPPWPSSAPPARSSWRRGRRDIREHHPGRLQQAGAGHRPAREQPHDSSSSSRPAR